MPLKTVRNDITKMNTDAIVLPANKWLEEGSGTSRAIYEAAGEQQLINELKLRYPEGCPIGEAVTTEGYNLPAKKIIHAVCPEWRGGNMNERELLNNAYTCSLNQAKANKLSSISFPLLSAGNYGYPKGEALAVANQAITDFLIENDMDVYLVLYTDETMAIGSKLFSEIREYIDSHYVEEKDEFFENRGIAYNSTTPDFASERSEQKRAAWTEYDEYEDKREDEYEDEYKDELYEPKSIEFDSASYEYAPESSKKILSIEPDLEDIINNRTESFHDMLMRLIEDSGMKGPDIYGRALMDKKLYSKIRTNPNYTPKKKTILSLAIALRLGRTTTDELLKKTGMALSDSDHFDLIVAYFIDNEYYDIFDINIALEELGETDFLGYN
ncbi:MAG: macro domain-containing protein [Eubacteriales bacterium]|nr:macro domain-containing protein [Eubacteriales bacterium]